MSIKGSTYKWSMRDVLIIEVLLFRPWTIKDNFIPDELRILDEWNGTKIKVGNLDLSGNYTGRLKFYVIDQNWWVWKWRWLSRKCLNIDE